MVDVNATGAATAGANSALYPIAVLIDELKSEE